MYLYHTIRDLRQLSRLELLDFLHPLPLPTYEPTQRLVFGSSPDVSFSVFLPSSQFQERRRVFGSEGVWYLDSLAITLQESGRITSRTVVGRCINRLMQVG